MIKNEGELYMDNLIMRKVWKDDEFFEIKIIAISDDINISTKCYSSKEAMISMQNTFGQFLNNKEVTDCEISIGRLGGNNLPAVKFRTRKDRTGHIIFDVTMELDDNAVPKHECNFYLRTDIGLLETLISNIDSFIYAPIDYEISLLN